MGFDLQSNFEQVADNVHAALNSVVLQIAENIVEDVETMMAESKSGRHYKRLPRRSSAPGEAPAVQSGDTQESYHAEREGDLKAIAYTNDENAERLEFGTKHIAPRPAFYPSVERASAGFEDKIVDVVNAAIERAGL